MARYTVTVEGPNGKYQESWPSVTEIIDAVLAKPGLADWYYKEGIAGVSLLLKKYGEKMPNDIRSVHSLMKQEGLSPYAKRDQAAVAGRGIHDAVEALTKSKKPSTRIIKDFPALADWWKTRGWQASNILAAEQTIVSFANRYAGTLDLVYTEDGEVVLSDVKSGAVRESHAVQLELYRWAWEENGGTGIDRMSVIQVPRDGGDILETNIDITNELTEAATGILATYRWMKRGKKR